MLFYKSSYVNVKKRQTSSFHQYYLEIQIVPDSLIQEQNHFFVTDYSLTTPNGVGPADVLS